MEYRRRLMGNKYDPDKVLIYTATFKLVEVSNIGSNGFYAGNFDQNVVSHTFKNGVGIIKFDAKITKIGGSAFWGCSWLLGITIPSSVESIGSHAFYKCINLTEVTLFDGLKTIENDSFGACSKLSSITIPSSVTTIKSQVFEYCSGLTSIICNATSAPKINLRTFYNIKTGGTLYVPTGSSGYYSWMKTSNYYLGKYGWTKVEQ